jgi:hypothetical protein
MTPAEAAKIIGCSPTHVRFLCRTGAITAKREESTSPVQGLPIHEYDVPKAEALRYRRKKFTRGKPRGSKNVS